MKLTHVDDEGRARMVDTGSKPVLRRQAVAEGRVSLSPETVELISKQRLPKGNPFEVARVAGIQAAKETSRLIPLCHGLHLDFIDVEIELDSGSWRIQATVSSRWTTGVEMEALTAVSVTALTLFDMCKAVDKRMTIGEIRVLSKTKEEITLLD